LSPESTRGGVQVAYGTYPSPQESAARRASGLRYARFQILFGALVLLGTPVYAALARRTNPGEPAMWGWPIAIAVVVVVVGLVRRRSALRL
jgi:asparagine N-glycosylation enzyme membrane subunit Stt3